MPCVPAEVHTPGLDLLLRVLERRERYDHLDAPVVIIDLCLSFPNGRPVPIGVAVEQRCIPLDTGLIGRKYNAT